MNKVEPQIHKKQKNFGKQLKSYWPIRNASLNMRIKRFKLNSHHLQNNDPDSAVGAFSSYEYLIKDKDTRIAALNTTVADLNKTILFLRNELDLKESIVSHLNGQIERLCLQATDPTTATTTPLTTSKFQDSTLSTNHSQTPLIHTYESLNSQLLEKLKLKEAENQSLKHKMNLLHQNLFSNSKERVSSMYLCTSSASDPEKSNKISNSLSCSSTAKSESDPYDDSFDVDRSSIQDSACFVSDLFDALPMINFFEEDQKISVDKRLDDDTKSVMAPPTSEFLVPVKIKLPLPVAATSAISKSKSLHHRKRSSVDSLLSLNKSAIRPPPLHIKTLSSSTNISPPLLTHSNTISSSTSMLNFHSNESKTVLRPSSSFRSLKSSGMRKVQQLSLYLAPASKDKFSTSYTSSSVTSNNPAISSPLSSRSSMYFGSGCSDDNSLEPSYTPLTPISAQSAQFPETNLLKKNVSNFENSTSNINAVGMSLLNGSKALLQKSMDIIREK